MCRVFSFVCRDVYIGICGFLGSSPRVQGIPACQLSSVIVMGADGNEDYISVRFTSLLCLLKELRNLSLHKIPFMVETHSYWAGPTNALRPTYREYTFKYGREKIRFLTVDVDSILAELEQLEAPQRPRRSRNRSFISTESPLPCPSSPGGVNVSGTVPETTLCVEEAKELTEVLLALRGADSKFDVDFLFERFQLRKKKSQPSFLTFNREGHLSDEITGLQGPAIAGALKDILCANEGT